MPDMNEMFPELRTGNQFETEWNGDEKSFRNFLEKECNRTNYDLHWRSKDNGGIASVTLKKQDFSILCEANKIPQYPYQEIIDEVHTMYREKKDDGGDLIIHWFMGNSLSFEDWFHKYIKIGNWPMRWIPRGNGGDVIISLRRQ